MFELPALVYGVRDPGPEQEHAGEAVASRYVALKKAYENTHEPLEISFRDLVSWLPYKDRATHFLHPYPAKLLFHIPYFFLNNPLLCSSRSRVFDPFCGSGTTLLEAHLAGISADGIDINPFSVLLANTKIEEICADELKEAAARVCCSASRRGHAPAPFILNQQCWYDDSTFLSLARLRIALEREPAGACKDAMRIGFSIAARTLSFADPRMPVPVKARPERFRSGSSLRARLTEVIRRATNANAVTFFCSAIDQMCSRFEHRDKLKNGVLKTTSHAAIADARTYNLSGQAADVDLIITSPPYCGAQKYVRSTSISLAWLGLATPDELPELESRTIGREHIRSADRALALDNLSSDIAPIIKAIHAVNPTRAAIASSYLREMRVAVLNMVRSLRRGGHAVLVVGDSQISGIVFPTCKLVQKMLEELQCKVVLQLQDRIRSRGLLTKRRSDASVITHEQIIVVQKGA